MTDELAGDDLAALIARAAAAANSDLPAMVDEVRNHPELDHVDKIDGEVAERTARLLAVAGGPNDLPAVAALARRAHEVGRSDAGLLYAEATDKMALYGGQPQPYGTVMIEHQGDIVQPPVDPTFTDAERIAVGVPSLTELRERIQVVSRQLAEERFASPGVLPPGERFCRVWSNPEPGELRARMESEGASAWADGDVITFVTESDVPVALTPVFPIPSWEAGDGLQVLSLRVERLEEAIITYTFTPITGGTGMSFSRGSHDGRFRGAKAPAEAPSNDPLLGSTFDHAVESAALGEARRVTVYKPPNHEKGEAIPVVYATDGNMFAPYARRLDAAIQARTCPRVVVVAAHSAPADQLQGNIRALEYLLGFGGELGQQRFDAHQRFFVDELSAWAETELGVPADPAQRAVFGCSDGGGHALTTGRLHFARFGHVFAYSTGMPPEPTMQWNPQTHPYVHLCAGTLEGAFHQATEAWAGYLHAHAARYHFTERVAGHDLIQWCEEFPNAVARAWG